MLKNYLKVALRNIIHHKGYSSINIIGLAIGMAICIIILLWAKYQFSYNTFHENIDNLYWVGTYYQLGKDIDSVPGSPPAIGPALKEDFPDIVRSTRYLRHRGLFKYGEKHFREQVKMVDPDFLEMFTFPLIKGDPLTALDDPYSIIISEKTAEKYFGDEDPIGKTLIFQNQHDFTVTGVAKNIPDNSTIYFDFLAPIACANEVISDGYTDTWYNCAFYTMAQLREGADYQAVSEKIRGRIKQSFGESNLESFLFPFSKLRLYSFSGKGGYIETVRMFLIIAILILVIAIINFVNLMTARSGRRAKEVGMRKVVGAFRGELIKQFFGEAILHAIIAAVIAIALVELLLPAFRTLMHDSVPFNFTEITIPLGILFIAILTGLLAGSYPALLLSSYRPVRVLKTSAGSESRRSWFRRILVVSQFAISILLIICTTIIYQQHSFMKHKEIGYDKDNIVYLPMYDEMHSNYDAVKAKLLQNPNFLSVSKSTHSPSGIYWNGENWEWEGKDPDVNPLVTYFGVGYDYLETLGMELVEGEFYSPEISGDRDDVVVINQAFANIMGLESIVGQRLSRNENNYTIMGVVKDFHYKPVTQTVGPLIMYQNVERSSWYLFARINPDNVSKSVAFLEDIWKEFSPDFPFECNFLDEDFEYFYYGEKITGDLLMYFAMLAIIISCMGLFGLSCFMAERRTKEIGIRKVLGATVTNLVQLLSREFVVLVIIANVIAAPAAYFIMKNWLTDYAYRIDINLFIFILAALLAILIAIFTVSVQAIKAASANPVDSLRYE